MFFGRIELRVHASSTSTAVLAQIADFGFDSARCCCRRSDGRTTVYDVFNAGYLQEKFDSQGRLICAPSGIWRPQFSEALRSGRYFGLELTTANGFHAVDLSFVEPWPICRLYLGLVTEVDLRPVSRLGQSLEELMVVMPGSGEITLEDLPQLRKLFASYRRVRRSLPSAAGLAHLSIERFTDESLQPLLQNTRLKSLRLNGARSLRDVDGLGVWEALAALDIQDAPQMRLGQALPQLGPSLRCLHLQRVADEGFDFVEGGLTSLAELSLTPVSHVVPSIRPLASLSQLRGFGLGAKVLDRDLAPHLALPRLHRLRMADDPSYVPSVAAIQDLTRFRAQRLTERQKLLLYTQIYNDDDVTWLDSLEGES